MRAIGLTLRDLSHDDAIAAARMAEDAGFDSVWMPEAPGDPDASVRLAGLATQTDRIGLATGVVAAPTRHPVEQAMAASALSAVSGGRFVLGLGSGNRMQCARLGIEPSPPIPFIREYVAVLRAAFSGESIDHDGRFFTVRDVRLHTSEPLDCPIFIAAHNPRMLRLAGEIADGVLLNMVSIDDVAIALSHLHGGDRELSAPIRVAAYLLTVLDEDREAAEAAARTIVASFCASETFRTRLRNYDSPYAEIAEDVGRRVWTEGPERLAPMIPIEMARAMAIACDPTELPARVAAYEAAGVDVPVLSVFPSSLKLRQSFPPMPTSGAMSSVTAAIEAARAASRGLSTNR